MRPTRIGATVALLIGIALAPMPACAGLAGVVTAVGHGLITVSGADYRLEDATEVVDPAGNPVTLPELRPGTPVELEFDEEGRLAVVRASVVR